MSEEDKLSEQEVAEMLAKLTKHFREPVKPVSKYCEAMTTWFEKIRETTVFSEKELEAAYHIRMQISKSNLLYRLIYADEPLRTDPCPLHKGKWSGANFHVCPYGCDETGWLKTPEMAEEQLQKYRDYYKRTDEEAVEFMQNYTLKENPSWEEEHEFDTHCEWMMLIGRGDLVPESKTKPWWSKNDSGGLKMTAINRNFWQLTSSTITTDKKLPALRVDISCPHSHTVREKNAVIHAFAGNLEWASKDTDHWTIETDHFGVQMNLVSRSQEEVERAVNVLNSAFEACEEI